MPLCRARYSNRLRRLSTDSFTRTFVSPDAADAVGSGRTPLVDSTHDEDEDDDDSHRTAATALTGRTHATAHGADDDGDDSTVVSRTAPQQSGRRATIAVRATAIVEERSDHIDPAEAERDGRSAGDESAVTTTI
jgi:hypothetical protein